MFLILAAVSAPAMAQSLQPVQTTPVFAAPAAAAAIVPTNAMIAPAPTSGLLRSGTEVMLKTSEYLTTQHKDLRVGQHVRLEVADNVTLNGRVVIPAGSPAVAELTDVRNKGMWGKSGHFNARVLNVRVGDRTIRLSGTFDDHGTTGTAGVVAAIAFIPIAGFITTGTSAKMPIGTPVKAFLDEDLSIL